MNTHQNSMLTLYNKPEADILSVALRTNMGDRGQTGVVLAKWHDDYVVWHCYTVCENINSVKLKWLDVENGTYFGKGSGPNPLGLAKEYFAKKARELF